MFTFAAIQVHVLQNFPNHTTALQLKGEFSEDVYTAFDLVII